MQLPSRKVSTVLLAGAASTLGFWLLGPGVFNVLHSDPPPIVVGAVVTIVSVVLAYLIPEKDQVP
jgi:hypothetical protein